MTTKYGTISTPPDHAFLSHHAPQPIGSGIGIQRPWKELLSFSFPESLNAALQRIRKNTSYFHVNYTIIILFTLFISLLWHPTSLIVFLLMMVAWLFLYLLRDRPIVVFGYRVDDRVVVVALSISTVVVLFFTHEVVFVVGVVVGLVVVMVHGVFRRTNDLVFYDEEQGNGRDERVALKETASASYSSS